LRYCDSVRLDIIGYCCERLAATLPGGREPTRHGGISGGRHTRRLYLADRGTDRCHDGPSKQQNGRDGRSQSTEAHSGRLQALAVQQVVDADHIQVRRNSL